MINKGLFGFLFSAFFLCFTGCDSKHPGDIAGSVGKAGNAVTGRIIDANGNSMNGLKICLYASNYDPRMIRGFSKSAVVSDLGLFRIENIESGNYTLIAMLDEKRGIAFTQFSLSEDSTKSLGLGIIKTTGGISGKVIINNDPALLSFCTVYLPGTSFFTSTNQTGEFTIYGVPAGSYDLIAEYRKLNTYYYGNNQIYYLETGVDTVINVAIVPIKIVKTDTLFIETISKPINF